MIAKLNSTQVNYLNIGLMVVSAACAMASPFGTFLFVYAVLGPAHYLTEISWLHDRSYFTKRKHDYLFLVGATVLVTVFYLGIISDNGSRLGSAVLFTAFATALVFVLTKSIAVRIAVVAAAAVAGFFLAGIFGFKSAFGIFLPTLIHVFIFTGMFILIGALKGKSFSGILSLAVFIAIAIGCFLVPQTTGELPSDYVQNSYGYMKEEDGSFTKGFIGLNDHIFRVFQLHEFGTPTRLTFAEWVYSVNVYLYTAPLALALMTFIAFAYMYHYLNWFSKTSIIQWHSIPKARGVAIVAIWAASLALYASNYAIGLDFLFFLSLLHVMLEFPLNHATFIGIGKELKKGAGALVASRRPVPATEGVAD